MSMTLLFSFALLLHTCVFSDDFIVGRHVQIIKQQRRPARPRHFCGWSCRLLNSPFALRGHSFSTYAPKGGRGVKRHAYANVLLS